jgi:penicillin-binding protein 1A
MSASTKSTPKSPGIKSGFPLRRWILRLVAIGAGLGVCAAIVVTLAVALAWPTLPDLSAMIDYRPVVPLRIYTADKVLIGEFGEEHRNVIPFAQIPDVLKHAVLSAEDDHFYQHGGVDWGGVVRAALTNLMSGAKTQGASTITMQVARNFYLSSEKT